MSGKIMGGAWDLDLSRSELLVLLAMADHADHEGNNVWPSVGLIAWKTGYSDRQVQRHIMNLTKKGILVLCKERPGRTKLYRVNLLAGKRKPPRVKSDDEDVTPDIAMSPLTPDVTPPLTPDVTPTHDITASPKPSCLSVNEPSLLPPSGGNPPVSPKRPPTKLDLVKLELTAYFEEQSGLRLNGSSDKEKATLWWNPLVAIYRDVDSDTERAKGAILFSLRELRKSGMSISSPKSILKTAQAEIGRRRAERAGNGHSGPKLKTVEEIMNAMA